MKASQKARALKEMFMTGGIEKRDFLTKMKKVNEFLTNGHLVKVTVVPKRFMKNDRFKNGVRRDRMAGKNYLSVAHLLCPVTYLYVKFSLKLQ